MVQEMVLKMYEQLPQVLHLLEQVAMDRTVPRNIRTSAEQVTEAIKNEKEPMDLRISSAIHILDEVSNDPNIPLYTRTQIWNIVSMLENCRQN
ncbi:MAG: UPF0147 family protein [Candidatus Aenigmarchaeota archaeon]|nr:UPF0147 family protein [Candidatus Aenigmarchaeota archaeon]